MVAFINGEEQRWQNTASFGRFTLVYSDIPRSDVDNLNNFVATVNASYGPFQFNLTAGDQQTFQVVRCMFMEDSFSWTETSEGLYSGQISFEQFGSGGLQWPSGDDRYPQLMIPGSNVGYVTGFPYVETMRYAVDRQDVASRNRTVYPYYGQGLANFPTRGLYSWEINLPALTNQQLAMFESHFMQMCGAWRVFAWTEPRTGRVFTRVRYAMDAFSVTHVAYNLNSTKILLTEVYGPGWAA